MNEPLHDSADWQTLRCRNCGGQLGFTTDVLLLVGAALIRQPITLECLSCGKRRQWRPFAAK